MALISSEQEVPPDLEVNEDLMDQFWQNRWQESRRMIIGFNAFMFVGTINNLANPKNPDEFEVSKLYIAWCLLIFTLVLLSYRQGPWLRLIHPAFICLWARLAVRLLDFENTKFLMSDPESETRHSQTLWT